MSLRNIAIIAHVDHGKTTLVDALLSQAGVFRANEAHAERAMDSLDQERERGITILAKATSVAWRGTRINIIDTPGHADFGGEVERILGLVDGALLLVDAAEGVMPQTKFVLAKALELALRPIVVLNKCDRPGARPDRVLEETFDLFADLGAAEAQLDFPHLYASGREGWAVRELDDERRDLVPLFETILSHVPPPAALERSDEPARLLAVLSEADPFLGRLLTGRVESGRLYPGMPARVVTREGVQIEQGRISRLLAFRGLRRAPIEEALAGDIVAVAGLARASVTDTILGEGAEGAIPAQPIDPPTIAISVSVNDSPLAGLDGAKVQSRVIGARLAAEAEANVTIQVAAMGEREFEVAGRGELQLGVLIETLRREGFELGIGRPRVILRTDPASGERLEPIEEVIIDVDDAHTGAVIDKLSTRRAELTDLAPCGVGRTRLTFLAPSRALIGFQGEFLTDTRGSGVLHRVFSTYAPFRGEIEGRRNGVLIANSDGETTAYALAALEARGTLFVGPGERTYRGMIIGENSRAEDLEVNPMRAKQLTNVRASAGKDEAIRLAPPRRLSLEQAIAYVAEGEVVEVTPKAVRLRKRVLDPTQRKRLEKAPA